MICEPRLKGWLDQISSLPIYLASARYLVWRRSLTALVARPARTRRENAVNMAVMGGGYLAVERYAAWRKSLMALEIRPAMMMKEEARIMVMVRFRLVGYLSGVDCLTLCSSRASFS